jgi:hypothetical protein
MNCSEKYEEYLERELSRCDSLHALCQKIAWLATSEMTELEQRQERLLINLQHLREVREARRRFALSEPSLDYDYTLIRIDTQEKMPDTQS